MTADPEWRLTWNRGEASILKTGAMLGPARFDLGTAAPVQPFAVAPWSNDTGPEFDALPPLLKRLRGEWVCVPFGMPDPPGNLPSDWLEGPPSTHGYGAHFHGYSSNAVWRMAGQDAGSVELVLEYPENHPVRRVSRIVRGIPDAPRIEFELTVDVRDKVQLPIGLHPTFRLPDAPHSAKLSFAGQPEVHTYPVQAEPGVSRFEPGRWAVPFDAVPRIEGSPVDLGLHPLDFPTEELVLVTGAGGVAELFVPDEGYTVRLRWDPGAFPGCMLWISNHGRKAYPWNGRFRAIGIEPIAAPFDLGTDVAVSVTNPLRRRGFATAHEFEAGQSWRTRYAIEVSRHDVARGAKVAGRPRADGDST
ncbi:MAG: hypothetical protein OXF56_26985 [Rhodobacteraceae bacterium]|nr:hypothetical protein [Paracoccaceae bacterium]